VFISAGTRLPGRCLAMNVSILAFRRHVTVYEGADKSYTYDFVVLTFSTHPRKILLVVLQLRKAKDLSAHLRIYNLM
jgi:hypothetical protein